MDNIFQSKEWEQIKLQTGYQKSCWIDDILILQKNLPLGFSMLYSPMVDSKQVSQLASKPVSKNFIAKIKNISRESNSIFYRLELDVAKLISLSAYQLTGFTKAFEEMQPVNTWLLDLNKSEEELLKEMSMRCRYNVRFAEKSGVTVSSSKADAAMLDQFYNLYQVTGKRHGITFRSKEYFKKILDILGEGDYARIYTANKDIDGRSINLVSGICVYSGNKAIYMFGASSNEMRNLKAPNLMVWQMIKDAKARGCTEFDFFGIAPTDDPKHHWAGITSFKKQFGGTQRDIAGSYDLILKPALYQVFKIVEKIRR